jgi:hypothetical protein
VLKINLKYIFLLLLLPFLSIAQNKVQLSFNHQLSSSSNDLATFNSPNISKPETLLNILAVMVEFVEDDDSRTTGNGKFDLVQSTKNYLDAPPHDINYFKNHLKFVENYFKKVSDGKLKVQTHILDSVYQLPHEMKYYSPSRNTKNNVELGYLIRDTWTLVDSLAQVRNEIIPYDQYDAFIIFHAGAGRDIDLLNIYGYDPTPYDIPSLYVNLKSMQNMFDDLLYDGIPVDSGRFKITNSMIIPETESREEIPFPLGINGLIAASVGSHLGLPDLFNTKNGRSGIGRFGLMDGQSIFSWNGAFPPEPSAWEKYYLGWIDPPTISSGNLIYYLPAVSMSNSVDTIYKVLISSKEYFMLENRNRDANKDGAIVTMMINGNEVVKRWERDTANFNENDQDSLYGVIVDVDEFDWSLPGGVDKKNNIFYDGGILIWHIDETVIENNLITNSVNANEKRRGVNLMEADGSQDIGQNYDFLHPGSGSESGWALDFWFKGNSAPLRKYDTTGFTPTSHPSSLSNDGANSHIYINNFSERASRMSARIRIGDDVIHPLSGFPKYVGPSVGNNSISVLDMSNKQGLIIATNGRSREDTSSNTNSSIYGWSYDGFPILSSGDTSGLMTKTISPSDYYLGKLGIGNFNNDSIPDLTVSTVLNPYRMPPIVPLSSIDGWNLNDQNNDHEIDKFFHFGVSRKIITSPTISDSFIAYGAENGMIYFVKTRDSINAAVEYDFDTSDVVGVSLWDNNSIVAISRSGTLGIVGFNKDEIKKNFGRPIVAPAASGNISPLIGKCIAFGTADGYVYLIDGQLNNVNGFPVWTANEISNSPAIADVDGDNVNDIVIVSGHKIFAFNASGAILDNFPIEVSTKLNILTSPIIAELDNTRGVDIVVVTQEGLVCAFNKYGKMLEGFPLLTGENHGSTPGIFKIASQYDCYDCPIKICIAAASDDGYVYAWETVLSSPLTSQTALMPWPQYLHDAQNTGLIEEVKTPEPRSSEFFPSSLAYNWPNPVTKNDGFKTRIRYFVREDAKVHIKIFDPAGDLVTEFDAPGVGGFDNEVEFDASGIQSGIYFAHIQANSSSNSGYAIIKIAVVR